MQIFCFFRVYCHQKLHIQLEYRIKKLFLYSQGIGLFCCIYIMQGIMVKGNEDDANSNFNLPKKYYLATVMKMKQQYRQAPETKQKKNCGIFNNKQQQQMFLKI